MAVTHPFVLLTRDRVVEQNIKSRAERNEIYYNWVSGGFYGEIELIGPDPHGNKKVSTDTAREDSDVVGNVFQHIPTQGTRMARVGGDGT